MITQNELKELLDYNHETGLFTWKISKGSIKANSIAGRKHKFGYIIIKINKKDYLAHRLAFLYMHGFIPKYVDHANRQKTDNRINNLREANASQNVWNRGMQPTNTSGCSGVYWCKDLNKWRATIGYYNKVISLGLFKNKDDAVIARKNAEEKYYGDFSAIY